MKDMIKIFIVFSMLLLIVPSAVFIKNKPDENSFSSPGSNVLENVRFLNESTGEVAEIPLREYLIGCVIAQMPYDFSAEALKAQAVICRTYIYHRRLSEMSDPTEGLKGADISDDCEVYQKYFSSDEAKSYYGDEYEAAYKACEQAVDETKGEILTYENSPIVTAFHAVSSGITESAANAWGVEIPYLVSVKSESDTLIKGAKKEYEFTSDEIFARIKGLLLQEEKSNDFSLEAQDITPCGTVKTMAVTNSGQEESINGTSFAAALNLASSCFEITYDKSADSFHITSTGVGHMVGLSQYGADYMAKEGKTYKEILLHYFTGVELTALL